MLIAVVVGLILKLTLPKAPTETSDFLAFYGFAATMATLALVGYQVALARQQNRILLRQDELLSRKESLEVIFANSAKRLSHVCTDAERDRNFANFSLPLVARNLGLKSATVWYVNIYVPDPPENPKRAFRGPPQSQAPNPVWNFGELVDIGSKQCRAYSHVGKDTLFPAQVYLSDGAPLFRGWRKSRDDLHFNDEAGS